MVSNFYFDAFREVPTYEAVPADTTATRIENLRRGIAMYERLHANAESAEVAAKHLAAIQIRRTNLEALMAN